MGVGLCPPEINCAFGIDELINQHAGTCDLNDSDINIPSDNSLARRADLSGNDSDIEVVHTTIKKADPKDSSACRTHTTTGMGLIKKIADSLEPSGNGGQQLAIP